MNHLIGHIQKTSQTLKQRLEALQPHKNIGDIRGRGLMYGVELVENKSTQTPLDIPTVELIIRRCKENGLMIRNLENVITFVPILSMSNKEIKKMVKIFNKALHQTLGKK